MPLTCLGPSRLLTRKPIVFSPTHRVQFSELDPYNHVGTGRCGTYFPKISFPSTPVPDEAPWQVLAPTLRDLKIEEYFFGWMFLASGTVNGGIQAH